MKTILIISILFLTVVPAFAQFGNETITITTYYPSPHGVYGVLTLWPRDTQPDPEGSRKGDLYYENGTEDPINRPEGVYIFNGTNWTITNIGGAGGGGGSGPETPTPLDPGDLVPVNLTTPLQTDAGSISIPAGTPVDYGTVAYQQISVIQRTGFGPLTEIKLFPFNIEREGVNASLSGDVRFCVGSDEPTCSCATGSIGAVNCCRADVYLDGNPVASCVPQRPKTQKYCSFSADLGSLSSGQHRLSVFFTPAIMEKDNWLSTCYCDAAQFLGGKIQMYKLVNQVVITGEEYQY